MWVPGVLKWFPCVGFFLFFGLFGLLGWDCDSTTQTEPSITTDPGVTTPTEVQTLSAPSVVTGPGVAAIGFPIFAGIAGLAAAVRSRLA